MSQYKPVIVHVDAEDWRIFQEICGDQKVSRRVRELVSADIKKFTREETRAQQLAGLTEA